MKIAYLIGSINRGGTESLLLDVFRKAKVAPFEMILVHRRDGELRDEFERLSPHSYHIGPKRGRYISYLCKLRKTLREENVTHVHAQFWLDCIYARLATVGMDIPILLTFHGYFLKRGWRALLIKLAIRMADKVCFVSRYEKQCYEEYYGNLLCGKAEVVYNGVNSEKLAVAESSVHSPVKLCCVGSFGGVRSQEVVAWAIKTLAVRFACEFEFYFIGGAGANGTKLLDECKEICKGLEYVHFLGARGDVPDLLLQMDAFVYSSRRDTFGIAVVEAMASGLPVVVNDYPVMQEIANDACVSFYKSGDVKDCAEKIQECLENIESKKQIALENVQRIRELYSIEQHIKRLSDIYAEF